MLLDPATIERKLDEMHYFVIDLICNKIAINGLRNCLISLSQLEDLQE